MRESRRPYIREDFTVTIENDNTVFIDGCIAVLVYESDRIVVRLRKRNLTVYGSALMLKSFSRRELCVSGLIASVELFTGNGRC